MGSRLPAEQTDTKHATDAPQGPLSSNRGVREICPLTNVYPAKSNPSFQKPYPADLTATWGDFFHQDGNARSSFEYAGIRGSERRRMVWGLSDGPSGRGGNGSIESQRSWLVQDLRNNHGLSKVVSWSWGSETCCRMKVRFLIKVFPLAFRKESTSFGGKGKFNGSDKNMI